MKHKCYFHRGDTGQSKCPLCGKFICLDCTQEKGICPVCHQKNVENQYGPTMGIAMGTFALIFLIAGIVSAAIDGFGFIMLIFGLLIFLGIGSLIYYVYVKSAPREKEKAREILEKAQQALLETKGQELNDYDDSNIQNDRVELTCRFCGASIKQGDTTCNYCGSSWVWKNF